MATAPKSRRAVQAPKSPKTAARRGKAKSVARQAPAARRAAEQQAEWALGDIDKLRSDILRLSQSVSTLMSAHVSDARSAVKETAEDLIGTGVGYAREAEDKALGLANDVAKQIGKNPLPAIGLVFGIGYLIGMMRRR